MGKHAGEQTPAYRLNAGSHLTGSTECQPPVVAAEQWGWGWGAGWGLRVNLKSIRAALSRR